jgi:hypothetical protein
MVSEYALDRLPALVIHIVEYPRSVSRASEPEFARKIDEVSGSGKPESMITKTY